MGILGLVSNGLGVSVYAESIARLKPQSIAIKPITDCDTQISHAPLLEQGLSVGRHDELCCRCRRVCMRMIS